MYLEGGEVKGTPVFRGGHGFESRSGLNFFQALISQLLKLSV